MRKEEKFRWLRRQYQRLIFSFVLLVLISLACNLPTELPSELPIEVPGRTQSYVQISVAETLAALEIDQPPGETDSGPEGTQIPGGTNTAKPSNPTSAAGQAKVYLSENTNCRTGQGTSFEVITILMKGEEAESVGVDTSGDYWFIRRPDKLTDFCWLWGGYATPSGAYASLPIYTQIPTATPGFEFQISYHANLGLCGGFHVLQYRIENSGSVTLESWQTTSIDHTGGSNPQPNQQNIFMNNGCVAGGEKNYLVPGDSHYIRALFTNDPTGHDLTVTAMICAADGLGGGCTSRTLSHTP
jgi:hypothetical protein